MDIRVLPQEGGALYQPLPSREQGCGPGPDWGLSELRAFHQARVPLVGGSPGSLLPLSAPTWSFMGRGSHAWGVATCGTHILGGRL